MGRKSAITAKQLEEILQKPFYNQDPRGKSCKASIQNQANRDRHTIQKCNGQPALERKKQSSPGMVDIPGPIHCRIIRHLGKRSKIYDDDNQTGGCKSLRDSIASALSLKGDSKEDGITFEYIQVKSKTGIPELEIEIYKVED